MEHTTYYGATFFVVFSLDILWFDGKIAAALKSLLRS